MTGFRRISDDVNGDAASSNIAIIRIFLAVLSTLTKGLRSKKKTTSKSFFCGPHIQFLSRITDDT
jgi:hypothetical protein